MKKLKFTEFKQDMKVLMNFDNLSSEEEDENIKDWYALYVTYHSNDLIEWALEQFGDCKKDQYDFWIDARGIAIFGLMNRVNDNTSLLTPFGRTGK